MPKKPKNQPKTKMYHFRMDPNDDRELEAIKILESYITDDIGVREVVTAGLYALEGREVPKASGTRAVTSQLTALVSEIKKLSDRMNEISVIRESGTSTPAIEEEAIQVGAKLEKSVRGLISPKRSYD